MSEEKPHFKLQVGQLNKDQLRELVGVIHFLSGFGLSVLSHIDEESWNLMKKENPVLAKMSPDIKNHIKMGEICHNGFEEWFKQIVMEAPPELEQVVNTDEFEKLAKDD
jgi:hypothetical protein